MKETNKTTPTQPESKPNNRIAKIDDFLQATRKFITQTKEMLNHSK